MIPDNMDLIYKIFKQSMNLTIEYDGNEYTFDDICAREYYDYHTCLSQENGIFSLWNFDESQWQIQDNIQSRLDAYSSVIGVC